MKPYPFILALLIFAACDSGNGGNSDPGVIMPLAVGNKWVYETITYDSAGTPVRITVDSLTIWKDTIVGTDRWYIPSYNNLFLRNFSDGLYYWINIRDSSTRYRELKYPGRPGDLCFESFDSTGSYITHIVAHIVSTDTIVTTYAGSFHCYKYERHTTKVNRFTFDTSLAVKIYEYYSPNIGEIAFVGYYRGEGPEVSLDIMKLKHFELQH